MMNNCYFYAETKLISRFILKHIEITIHCILFMVFLYNYWIVLIPNLNE